MIFSRAGLCIKNQEWNFIFFYHLLSDDLTEPLNHQVKGKSNYNVEKLIEVVERSYLC